MDVARGGEHFLSAGTYADVFSEIFPTHDAGAIDEEFRRAGDVVSIRTCRGVQQVVTADDLEIGIREERKCVAGLAAQVRGDLGRVNADGDGTNSESLEILKLFLDASQLEEAERSPVASVENQ